MRLSQLILFWALFATLSAEEIAVTILASIDHDRVAATGLKAEEKKNVPDFTITYLRGPEITDTIGIYEGGNPTLFSTHGNRLGEVKDRIAGRSVAWVCWSQVVDGKTHYGAEALLPSRRTVVRFEKKEEEFVTQFHVFVIRADLKALAEARKLAASVIREGQCQGFPIRRSANRDAG
jgi:hypothetical protein